MIQLAAASYVKSEGDSLFWQVRKYKLYYLYKPMRFLPLCSGGNSSILYHTIEKVIITKPLPPIV
jgi:hypothetical protein